MIFVVLGTQNFKMDRVIDEVEKLVENGFLSKHEIIVQYGYSKKPQSSISSFKFMNNREFTNTMDKCDIIITHAGTGSILKALELKKKIITIPRQASLNEHVDNHQFEISKVFSTEGYTFELTNISALNDSISYVRKTEFKVYKESSELLSHLNEKILKLLE